MFNPVATYRLQFHKEFTFDDLDRIIPYLKKLGVTTIYASPIFAATPGSTHGYDGVDPLHINPEVGTKEQLLAINRKLKENGISWLQDIVPNHMAFHPDNTWLMDVLEKGQESQYASFFDIHWESPVYNGKVMVPFLGAPLEEVIAKGELQLALVNDKPVLKYFDSSYPINEQSHKTILTSCEGSDLRSCIEAANKNTELIQKVSEDQYYRLCYWQETDRQINFRRFFTINGLICLNMQDRQVFLTYHQLIKKLVDGKVFNGLRIDHIDGLYDPTAYLAELKDLVGEDTYVIVEKILQHEESLPEYWDAEGNSGYDFLALVNNLFSNTHAEEKFTQFYHKLVADDTSVEGHIREKKSLILHEHMGGELENLYQLFLTSELVDTSGVPGKQVKEAIGQFLVECPVYRFYGNSFPLDETEGNAVAALMLQIKELQPDLVHAVGLLEEALLQKPVCADNDYNDRARHFYQRCMQFSGPLMAKGVEDTLMYAFNRYIGHNDVGDGPAPFGITVAAFHQQMLKRQQRWKLSINTTSTHDTKRGEDVRARLNVLTDLPDEWLKKVQEWRKLNKRLKKKNAPDANDEYFIYQTIAGAYPMPGREENDFVPRMEEYLEKALREAKVHSGWTTPNETYENAAKEFVRELLNKDNPFWKSFEPFHKKIADFGIVNSLAKLLLKFTCPGIPDTYQGTELWDLSLVDPDNRRPVNYNKRLQMLEALNKEDEQQAKLETLWQQRTNPRIKLWLTTTLLNERKNNQELFTDGLYIPLQVEGRYKDNVIAFARRHKLTWYVVAAPLQLAQLCKQQKKDIDAIDWKNTRILPGKGMPASFTNQLSGTTGNISDAVYIKDIFKLIPLALLKLEPQKNDRAAGILLAISSLPSAFGVGDLGPEARKFVEFLSRGKQKYWQILPLNPTESGAGHSPYSSFSSMGGNPLLISPELLAEEGLLDKTALEEYHLPVTDKADYEQATKVRNLLFHQAYDNFRQGNFAAMKKAFSSFCKEEAAWLDDMALYKVLKQQHDDKPWNEWEHPYKERDAAALSAFTEQHSEAITQVKWLQFIFMRQWKSLRSLANTLGIQLFGDMPFYVSYDSVDVWAHRDIFCLDSEGNMSGMAGVPPDYFSEDGQLWGMPTFNWNKVKEHNYGWWVLRLRKNLELFDLLRIDHFRALQDYWQVPAGEKTARNGEWTPGPRQGFFDVMEKELGKLPFVAEDLGDKMEAVYELRNQVNLPGMKVLQFAWGDNMPTSVDIPHNYKHNTIVYTGTHDNNTTIGWYKEETNSADHARMHHYLGLKVRRKNIHEILARVAYASVARIAMLPIQDLLGLDQATRMNTPGTVKNNWQWRLTPGQADERIEDMLRDWVETFNRF